MRWNVGIPRRFVVLTLALAMTATVAACGSSDDDDTTAGTTAASTPASTAAAETTATQAAEGFKLGFAYGLENTPIFQNVLRPVEAAAAEDDVEVLTGSADSQCDKQIQDMQNMIQSGVQALVFLGLCGEGNAYDKVLADAASKDIVTVSYSFQHPEADGSVQFNDPQGAKLFADNAIAWIKDNYKAPYDDFSYATLPCSFAPPPIQLRTKVVAEAVTKLTGKKPYDSVDCALAPEPAKKAVTTYLRKDPGLDMVIGTVDAGAYGAYLAMKQAGKSGDVYVGGMDGTQESIALLAKGGDGIYKFSGALPFRQLGEAVVDVPGNIIAGEGADSEILNYTAITADDPDQAKQWLQENFLAFQGE
jgi:ABC-type sugar transport system substrate-binding protein